MHCSKINTIEYFMSKSTRNSERISSASTCSIMRFYLLRTAFQSGLLMLRSPSLSFHLSICLNHTSVGVYVSAYSYYFTWINLEFKTWAYSTVKYCERKKNVFSYASNQVKSNWCASNDGRTESVQEMEEWKKKTNWEKKYHPLWYLWLSLWYNKINVASTKFTIVSNTYSYTSTY